jgi:predicted  nucleic acid-binding Zn-ribbon protein
MTDEALAATPAATPAPEAQAVATTEPSAPSPEVNPTDAPAAETKVETAKPELTPSEKAVAAMQKRIDRLTARLHDAERQKAQQPTKADAPKPEDFDTQEDFLIAKGKFEAKQEFAEAEKAKAKEAEERAYKADIEAQRAKFDAKEAELRKTTPDYDSAMSVLNEYVAMADQRSVGFQVFRDVLMLSLIHISEPTRPCH